MMQSATQSGGRALEAAFARVDRFPSAVEGTPLAPLLVADAYDDDYVDAPYDDYLDNAPEED